MELSYDWTNSPALGLPAPRDLRVLLVLQDHRAPQGLRDQQAKTA